MPSDEYLRYIDSPQWRQKSSFVKQTCKERCFVCGDDWKAHKDRRLTVHHLRYRDGQGKSLLGKEGPRDLVPLCNWHHVRGKCGWDTLRLMRLSYLATKLLWWFVRLPVRLLRLLARAILRLLSLLRRK